MSTYIIGGCLVGGGGPTIVLIFLGWDPPEARECPFTLWGWDPLLCVFFFFIAPVRFL